jgi:hypothetical protein
MECYKIIGQVVLPVFYDVLPSDIRAQSSEFGKAFESLLSRLSNKGGMFSKAFDCFWNSFSKDDSHSEVQRWKEALGQAAGLAGYVVQNSRYFEEKKVISSIIFEFFAFFLSNFPGRYTIDRYIPNMYVYI